MASVLWLFDLVLVLTLLWLAWNLLRSKDLFRAVVLFIIFGLLMVIAWVRLKAPDIALAEAAIGTGLTGVLLLDVIGHLEKKTNHVLAETSVQCNAKRSGLLRHPLGGLLLLLVIAAIGGTIIRAVALLPLSPQGLTAQVDLNMALSGVSSQVTAVLLNFRGYDTLLEIGVMLVAVVGVISLRGNANDFFRSTMQPDSLLSAFMRLIVPVGMMVGAYLLYEGAYAPGGAFQGGSVLAATLVLLRLSGFPQPSWLRGRITDALMFAGFVLFLFIAGGVTFMGNSLLEYPKAYAGELIFLIEAALAVSIAFILAELFSAWGEP